MPFVRVSIHQADTDGELAAISDRIQTSFIDAVNVPATDRFQVITRHPASGMVCMLEYLYIKHGDRVLFVQITANEGRTLAMKKALFAALASSIAATGAVTADNMTISLIEVKKENWSFGNGIAQYVA